MANFGFSRLSVVAPYAEHWNEARSAVGAESLLLKARETPSLAEAISHCTLVIGTATFTKRIPEQTRVSLPSLAGRIRNEVQQGGHVALVFGSEKRGLTREDLSRCHLVVEIPTEPQQPSMNLAQAVAVCLYELSREWSSGKQSNIEERTAIVSADSGSLDLLGELIEKTMVLANYSPSVMQSANAHDLRLMLRRLCLNPEDARRILGLFRRISRKIEHLSRNKR